MHALRVEQREAVGEVLDETRGEGGGCLFGLELCNAPARLFQLGAELLKLSLCRTCLLYTSDAADE